MLKDHSEMVLHGMREEGATLVATVPPYRSAFLGKGHIRQALALAYVDMAGKL